MRNVRLIVGMVVLAGLMTPIVLAQDKAKDSTRGIFDASSASTRADNNDEEEP